MADQILISRQRIGVVRSPIFNADSVGQIQLPAVGVFNSNDSGGGGGGGTVQNVVTVMCVT